MQAEPVEFTFTPTPKDYERAARLFYTRQRIFWALVALLVIFALLAILTLALHPSPLSDVAFFIIFGLICFAFLVGTLVFTPLRLKRQAAQNQNLTSEMKWQASEDALEVTLPDSKSILDWQMFGGYAEGQEYFLLLSSRNKNSFQMIPKRSFKSRADQDTFRALLKKRLTKK